MKFRSLLCAISLAASAACSSAGVVDTNDTSSDEESVVAMTDTKIKNQIVKASDGLLFTSESDHPLVWVRSSSVATAPANAWFVHHAFSKVTDGDAMADKPLSKLKSETVAFETFASRYAPVSGEDEDNYAYHVKLTKVLDLVRTYLKDPIVIRLGRKSSYGLVGAISVYIIGTLPSGKIGGLFTVSVET